MENKDLTRKVMDKVISFERKRSTLWIKVFLFTLSALSLMVAVYFLMAIRQVQGGQIFDLLSLFGEDSEIIEEFWQDTLSIFLEQLPVWSLIYGCLALIAIFIFIVITNKKRSLIQKKLLAVEKYGRKDTIEIQKDLKGETVYKKTRPLIFVLLLIAIALGVITYTQKESPSSRQKKEKDEITQYTPEITPSQDKTAFPTIEQISPTISPSQMLRLLIINPANGSTVTNPLLIIKGITSPKVEVLVNEVEAVADSQGNFSVTLTLDEGENYIVIVASDEDGNSAEQELIVNYEPTQ